MTWNTLTDLNTNDVVTATHMDEIRQNIEHLGSMRVGVTALNALALGAQITYVREAVVAYHSANQTVPGSGSLSPTFDSELFDDATFHDTSTNPERLSLGTGTWLIGFTGNLTASGAIATASEMAIKLWRSGTEVRRLFERIDTMASGDYMGISAAWIVPASASEYFTLTLTNNSTVNLTLQSGYLGANFWAQRIGE